jgi:hypothetical protein
MPSRRATSGTEYRVVPAAVPRGAALAGGTDSVESLMA